jgi:hypothetical protein
VREHRQKTKENQAISPVCQWRTARAAGLGTIWRTPRRLALAHFVYRLSDGSYAGTRKAISPRSYQQRISRADTLEDARVFNTRPTASVAGRALDPKGYTVEVFVRLGVTQ